jgi:hypothetical protein
MYLLMYLFSSMYRLSRMYRVSVNVMYQLS